MDNKKGLFSIAGLTMEVTFNAENEDLDMIPSFKYFSTKATDDEPYIKVTVEKFKNPVKHRKMEIIKTTNGSVGISAVCEGYLCFVYDEHNKKTCIIKGNANSTRCRCQLMGCDMSKPAALKTALMIIYIHASSFKKRLLIHSSSVVRDGRAFCFMGDSGEGKSTQSDLWVKNIPGSSILNDDNPILQICDDNKVMVWGSPWSGKTNYYINDSAEMAAMVMMSHGKENKIKKTNGVDSLQDMLSSSSYFPVSDFGYRRLIKNVVRVVDSCPLYEMSCLPDGDAARLCYDTISRQAHGGIL